MSNDILHDGGQAVSRRSDALDPDSRNAARRGWMRHYLRSSVKGRLVDLDALTEAELKSLEVSERKEPTP